MESPPHAVRRLKADDVPAVSALVARAFEDDPLYEWFLPERETRLAKEKAMNKVMFKRLSHIDFFEMYTTADRAGAAIWAGPDRWEPPTGALVGAMPRLLRILGLRGAAKVMRALDTVKKAHPRDPHWYLMLLASDPPRQRTGVGTALLAPMLERCDAAKLGSYLETQRAENVPYYKRFGFRVRAQIDLPKDGPHLWLMWRDPL